MIFLISLVFVNLGLKYTSFCKSALHKICLNYDFSERGHTNLTKIMEDLYLRKNIWLEHSIFERIKYDIIPWSRIYFRKFKVFSLDRFQFHLSCPLLRTFLHMKQYKRNIICQKGLKSASWNGFRIKIWHLGTSCSELNVC